MSKTIRFSISPKSLKSAIKELKAYKAEFGHKCDLVVQKLVEYGRQTAEERFAFAQYDGEKDITVKIVKEGTKYMIVANGWAVAFIEFGAGVHYNGPDGHYPLPKPEGIVGIGEYGFKMGRNDSWTYQEGNVRVVSYGNPAAMPMYFASVEMRQRLQDAVREVFGNA